MSEQQKKLTPKQELFCQYFASDREFFGNGTESYIEAFDIDLNKKGAYAGARASASRLLTKANILQRINELLETGILNDEFVDKQIAFLIAQNAELGTKLGAIKEYNALKQRVTKKLDLTTGGEPFEPVVVRIIDEPARDTNTQ
jgi:phage terminase small subunit